jgi:transcriptional regulator with XRE-family HTH domain
MRVTLRGADGHPRRLGDLVERVAERVLQQDDLRLLRRDPGERLAQLASLGRTYVSGIERDERNPSLAN